MKRSSRPGFLLLLALTTGACGSATVPTVVAPPAAEPSQAALPAEAPPRGPLPSDVTPEHYALALTIVPDRERFSGRAQIRIRLERERDVIWLHGRALHVERVTVTPADGEPIDATWDQVNDEGVVALRLSDRVGAGEATLDVTYDAPFDRTLEGLYRVDTAGLSYAFTQFEAISARLCFPSFDEPRFKTPFDVTLTVKREHVAVSNTLVVDEQEVSGGMKRVRFATTQRLPTYLLAFAVGPLDVVDAAPIPPNDVRSRPLPFRGIAVHGQGERLRYALEHTPAMVADLERYFGVAYPYDKLDIVAVPDFAAGAMENAGLITFREWLLLVDEATATEAQKRAYAYVMAHELSHQWFGNLVTMPWWDDIWLNEAFATWMGNKVILDLYEGYHAELSQLASIHRAMRADSLTTARQIRQPIESTHDIHNAFDTITYSKGGGVLAMFERWIGADTFREGIRLHLRHHLFDVATADDLLAALSEAAGRDVATPFRTFLMQPGVPFLETSVRCDPVQGAATARDHRGARSVETPTRCEGGARLSLRQSRYLPTGSTGDRDASWQLPVCLRYEMAGEIHESCTLVSEAQAEIPLGGDAMPSWLMPNADGAGYYRFSLPAAGMRALRSDRARRALTPRERMAYADSLQAAFDSGALPASQVFAALEPLARDDVRAVATTPMGLISFARDHIADEALRPRVQGYGRRLYRSLARRLGWGPRRGRVEDGETRMLRGSVIDFLAMTARDPRVRREAARRGRAYVGYGADGRLHPGAVESNLIGTALAVAVQEGDGDFFTALTRLLFASDDALERGRILRALGAATDPLLATRALDLTLDERLRTNEVQSTLSAQLSQPETREAAWGWMRAHFDALVARVGRDRAGGTPWFVAGFCDEAHRAQAAAFFEPRIEALQGGPRNLAGALEAIQLCAARVQEQGQDARAYFAGQRP